MSYLLVATSLKYWYWTPRVNKNENAQPQRSTIVAEAGTARSASINLVPHGSSDDDSVPWNSLLFWDDNPPASAEFRMTLAHIERGIKAFSPRYISALVDKRTVLEAYIAAVAYLRNAFRSERDLARGLFRERLPGSWNGQRYGRRPVTESYLTAAMPFTIRTNCGGRFRSLGWRRAVRIFPCVQIPNRKAIRPSPSVLAMAIWAEQVPPWTIAADRIVSCLAAVIELSTIAPVRLSPSDQGSFPPSRV
ncbi:hypothetical protein K438DRAFT_1943955 [Mycena galopus ATCC 62051]|nr:hypothetical protein K438DRAFT_1943955 [Mycena galopus ATCC 62051]